MSRRFETGDYLVTCPFDPVHRLIHHRLQTHLVKCCRNFPHIKTMACIYNATHIISSTDYAHHNLVCDDRYLLDRAIYLPEDIDRKGHPVVVRDIDSDESWEDWGDTYNPQEKCESAPVLRKKDVAPKSERRGFRMDERERFNYLINPTECEFLVHELSLAVQCASNAVVEEDPQHIKEYLAKKKNEKEEENPKPPPIIQCSDWSEVRGRGRGRRPNKK